MNDTFHYLCALHTLTEQVFILYESPLVSFFPKYCYIEFVLWKICILRIPRALKPYVDEKSALHEEREALLGLCAAKREKMEQSSGVVVDILRNAFN